MADRQRPEPRRSAWQIQRERDAAATTPRVMPIGPADLRDVRPGPESRWVPALHGHGHWQPDTRQPIEEIRVRLARYMATLPAPIEIGEPTVPDMSRDPWCPVHGAQGPSATMPCTCLAQLHGNPPIGENPAAEIPTPVLDYARGGAVSRPTKAEYGQHGADWASSRGDCTRRQVGAVLFDRHGRVVMTGYNGAPPGVTGCLDGGCPRGRLTAEELPAYASYDAGAGMCISAHAEANALLHADPERAIGGRLEVSQKPCFSCSKLIASFAYGQLAAVAWPGGSQTPLELLNGYLAADGHAPLTETT